MFKLNIKKSVEKFLTSEKGCVDNKRMLILGLLATIGSSTTVFAGDASHDTITDSVTIPAPNNLATQLHASVSCHGNNHDSGCDNCMHASCAGEHASGSASCSGIDSKKCSASSYLQFEPVAHGNNIQLVKDGNSRVKVTHSHSVVEPPVDKHASCTGHSSRGWGCWDSSDHANKVTQN